MFNINQSNTIFIGVALVILLIMCFRYVSREKFDSVTFNASSLYPINDMEEFVPWNSQNVGKYQISAVKADQLSLEGAFQKLINEDSGKIDTSSISEYRNQPVITEQARIYINHILARINRMTDRRFHILDVQATFKETAIDARDRLIVDRYKTELFVQEKDSRKVSAHAMNIRVVFIVKGQTIKITELHFITDYFYNRPLVDGYNPTQKNTISTSNSNFGVEYFRILNPFHLTQPFFTSEDKVLPSDNDQETLLVQHDTELAKPNYRCFEGSGDEVGNNKEQCDLRDGYWDKPVTRDEECPFFMANKNFPNRLGGVDPNGNRCEMPVGTKRIGYRYISADPIHKPWCYGCNIGADGQPGSAGPCCDEQLNKDLYPNLVTPDYVFPGDALERGQFWQELSERGINWQRHPTKIRDITNPKQKQPVFNAIIGPGPGKM